MLKYSRMFFFLDMRLIEQMGRKDVWLHEQTWTKGTTQPSQKDLGNNPIWVPIFLVLPKYSQFADYSMTVRNYAL
jgi:hypothetical protein